MEITYLIFTVLLFTIACWFAVQRINKLQAAGGSKMQIKLPTFAGTNKNTLIAVIIIAVGITVVWIWRGTIFAFPSMSAVQQTMTVAGLLFVTLATYGVWQISQKGDSVWPQRFAVVALSGILLMGGLAWTFGEAELTGATQQDLFIGKKPNAMGWTNINGDFIVVHGLTPHICVPTGQAAFDAEGNIFPFHLTEDRGDDDCYKNGIALLPNSREGTPDVSGFTPQGIIGKLTSTPAEIAAEAAAEQAAVDEAQEHYLARVRARNPAPQLATVVNSFGECHDTRFVDDDIAWCGTASFQAGQKIVFDSTDHCPMSSQSRWFNNPIPIGNGFAEFTANRSGTAIFYMQKTGSNVLNQPCG